MTQDRGPKASTAAEPSVSTVPPREPRQRWRIVFARRADPNRLTHRDVADAWLAALTASGLPLAGGGRGRQPLTFGLPLPAGIAAEREVADLVLVERLPIAEVRPSLLRSLPPGVALVDLHDVWLGAPAIAASVVAADYRVTVADATRLDGAQLAAAAAELLASASVPIARQRGGGEATVDLRPLVDDIRPIGDAGDGGGMGLWIRCRVHPERGSGRPEEVVAAISAIAGRDVEVGETVRERVVLAEDRADPASDPTVV
jgi:radical SAM-linked protein